MEKSANLVKVGLSRFKDHWILSPRPSAHSKPENFALGVPCGQLCTTSLVPEAVLVYVLQPASKSLLVLVL